MGSNGLRDCHFSRAPAGPEVTWGSPKNSAGSWQMGEYIFPVQMLLWASPREQVIGALQGVQLLPQRKGMGTRPPRNLCGPAISSLAPSLLLLIQTAWERQERCSKFTYLKGEQGKSWTWRTVREQGVEHVIKYRMDCVGLNRNALPSPVAAMPVSLSLSHLLSKQNL